MVIVVEFVSLSVIISSVFGQFIDPLKEIPLLPDTYKDIFLGSQGGKPQLGSMKATCWARGGMCMHIRHCPDNKSFDTEVSGCTSNFKVCCKMFKMLSPTVGITRSRDEEEDIQEINKDVIPLGDSQDLISLFIAL